MAETETQPLGQPQIPAAAANPLQSIPGLRQLLLLFGLAAAVAVGTAVALWSQSPNYRVLYPSLDQTEMGPVATVLETAGIEYQIDHASGSLVVAADKLNDAQLLLAGQGLPRSKGVSLENLYEGSGYSTSQFMESKFYTHALENKLARVISGLNAVKAAEISLGLPKPSVFIRDRKEPTASILVHLYPGRSLEPSQVKAIVHLVASSVPELSTSNVTLLDQNSNLLSDVAAADDLGAAASQFEYKQRLENSLAENIDALLVPIMGQGRSRTKVVAQVDFSEMEETTERFDPAGQVVRSEQSKEQSTSTALGAIGIPGALSNQPPTAPAPDADAQPTEAQQNTMRDRTLNYEVDRTISRKRAPKGRLERLSVAVVLDYLPAGAGAAGGEGEAAPQALPPEKLEEIRGLIREAVGFDEARGDTLNLINQPFQSTPAMPDAEPPPIWEQPWVMDVAKLVIAVLVGLALVLFVLRPLVQGLVQAHRAQAVAAMVPQAASQVQGYGEAELLPQEEPLQLAQNLASSDPKRIAQVVKHWVAADG